MILGKSLCVNIENEQEERDLQLVLGASKNMLALTVPEVKVFWHKEADYFVIFGSDKEIELIEQNLRVSLGLMPNVDRPFDLAQTDRQSSERTTATIDDIPFDSTLTIEDIFPVEQGWTPEEIESVDNYQAELEEDARNQAMLLNRECLPANDTQLRFIVAQRERTRAEQYRNNTMLEPDLRVEWNTAYDRLEYAPSPTESASGSYSIQEQIDYSEHHNPRHWNLVKVRYNGRTSGFYLTYLCPPTVDINTTLRVNGGVHSSDTPEAFEVCVYNSEPYWRELRHMMHQQVTFLRETFAA